MQVKWMPTKLKISKEGSEYLDYLSNKLNLRRNIICRLAVGRSLDELKSVKDFRPKNSSGFEFNRYTLTGEFDEIFKALINQHEGRKLTDDQYFSSFLRNHIERGVVLLYEEYEKINSPVDFLVGLVDFNKY